MIHETIMPHGIATNTPTRYEITLERVDHAPRVIGYTGRHSIQGLVAMVADRSPDLLRVTQLAADSVWLTLPAPAKGFTCDGWIVRFSGRTERDAKQSPLGGIGR